MTAARGESPASRPRDRLAAPGRAAPRCAAVRSAPARAASPPSRTARRTGPISTGVILASGADSSPAIAAICLATSSNSTTSPLACDSVSCTSAIDPTLRTASWSAADGLWHPHPAGLQPEQGGDGLQVVLHPVVNLPDRGVLGDQLALAVPQLGHVPEQDQRPGPQRRRRSAGSSASGPRTRWPRPRSPGAPGRWRRA